MNKKKNNFGRNLITSEELEEKNLFDIFKLSDDIRKNPLGYNKELNGKIVAMLFYEPSTRTRLSFESAVLRLGGDIITTENAKEFSSASKGETIEDSMKVISVYADFVILRHYEDNSSERAVIASCIPVINAGSGKSQHPTQSLLDSYTIYQNFGNLINLKIAFVGDLLRGRTVDSLVQILSKFKGNEFYFVAPSNSTIKDKIKKELNYRCVKYTETEDLEYVMKKVDVLYMTRVQKERFESMEEYEKVKDNYVLDLEIVKKMKKDAIILHPLPRIDEIEVEVDDNHRAKYFEQVENGLWIRMAILKTLNDYNYGK